MFPVPLPKPGYYAATLTDLQACVPLTACPGVDPGAVQEAYQRLLSAGGDGIERLLQLLNITAVCVQLACDSWHESNGPPNMQRAPLLRASFLV